MVGYTYKTLEERISGTRFGFRSSERCKGVNYNVFLSSIDFLKVLDNIYYEKMFVILKTFKIDDKDFGIIYHLQWHQAARTRIKQ